MDFKTLIWIAVILVYILGFILKRMFAASKAAKQPAAQQAAPKKSPGWKEKLDGFMAQLRKELEVDQREQSEEKSGWDDLIPRESRKLEPREIEPLESGAEVMEGSGISSEAVSETTRAQAPPSGLKPPERPDLYAATDQRGTAPADQRAPDSALAIRIQPVATVKKRMPINSKVGIQDLRRAIIWSEILAPPIALRDFPERKIG